MMVVLTPGGRATLDTLVHRPGPLVVRPRGMLRDLFDRAVAAAGLLLLSPLFAVVALLIKLDSRGPVFFRHNRVGRDFRPFGVWKFRTMRQDAPALGGPLTIGEDPRVTRVGRLLRQAKIDELPQLINVLTGEMSLVGPRPEVRQYVDLYLPAYRELLQVRPGLTDLAALAYRNEAAELGRCADPEGTYVSETLPRKLRLSRESVERSSLWFDLGILAATAVDLARDWLRLGARLRVSMPRARLEAMRDGALRHRRPAIVILQLGLAAAANWAAFWLRFDGSVPPVEQALFRGTLPWLLGVRGVAFAAFRVNEGLWRYAGLWDLRCILLAVGTSTVAWYGIVHGLWGIYAYPRSVFIIDALLLVFALGGVRLTRRLLPEGLLPRGGRRVLIAGAGDCGETIVRSMRWNAADRYVPVGFVDDDPGKRGQYIHGVPVLGTWDELPTVVSATRPQEVLIAAPTLPPASLRRVLSLLEPFPVDITRVPDRGVAAGRIEVAGIRSLAIEDLLERAPVGLDDSAVRTLLTGRRVLVTGAGGSIGSELCAQIARLSPAGLVLYERYENNLYTVLNALHDSGIGAELLPVVGDVTDAARLACVFEQMRPDVVFHAAAHKHVPLMEVNPCEAVKNNVIGTRLVAQAASRHGVERMILISSDKAVNPTSVMGATKRVAELLLAAAGGGRTRFATVRFGNVLGSNGSVVPRFLDQIRAGGPITVTHPDIRRYFMLTSEAVELVLQAAALAEPGAVYVLDMGEQVRLLDLARSLIRLAGLVPERDIEITFTGLRPGEKLHEELVGPQEESVAAAVPKVLRIRRTAPLPDVAADIGRLEALALAGDEARVLEQLRVVVPTFTPWAHGAPAMPAWASAPVPRTLLDAPLPEPASAWAPQ